MTGADPSELEGEGHPAMRRIPPQIREEQSERDDGTGITPWRQKPTPRTGLPYQPCQSTDAQKKTGVFRQQREATCGAQNQKPAPVPGLVELDERKQEGRGAGDERRIR